MERAGREVVGFRKLAKLSGHVSAGLRVEADSPPARLCSTVCTRLDSDSVTTRMYAQPGALRVGQLPGWQLRSEL